MSDLAVSPRKYHARRSRLVQVLRLVLPLTALVMLSLLFLLAEPVDPERAIAEAQFDVLERARDPRLTGAEVAGVTPDGTAIRLSAAVVRTDPSAILRFEGTGLELNIDGAQGETLSARSHTGVLDRGTGSFSMQGDVMIEATPGYSLQSPAITGLLDQTSLQAEGPLIGQAPAGSITAGAMRLTRQAATDTREAAHVLLFTGGVRLLYFRQPRDDLP
jgi:lipopolysaccharide export system protein LptC